MSRRGYVRQGAGIHNIESQAAALRRRRIPDTAIYFDNWAEGVQGPWPTWERLLKEASPGDTVVVETLDRLGSSVDQTLSRFEELRQQKIKLRTLNDRVGSTVNDRLGIRPGHATCTADGLLALLTSLPRLYAAERAARSRSTMGRPRRLPGRPRLPEEKRQEVIQLHIAGHPRRRIVSQTGVSRTSVDRIITEETKESHILKSMDEAGLRPVEYEDIEPRS